MCVGIPRLLAAVDGIVGRAPDGDGAVAVDLSLVPDARPGDWVLDFLGAARSILSPDEALKIRAAVAGLAALMRGEGLGDAFADLDAAPPRLPPHLQAAQDAGRTTG
jgi:hydrogenase expression/formation protein HypC